MLFSALCAYFAVAFFLCLAAPAPLGRKGCHMLPGKGASCARKCGCEVSDEVQGEVTRSGRRGTGFSSRCVAKEAFECLHRECCRRSDGGEGDQDVADAAAAVARRERARLTTVAGLPCKLPKVAAGRCVRRCGCDLEADESEEDEDDDPRAQAGSGSVTQVHCSTEVKEDCVLDRCCDSGSSTFQGFGDSSADAKLVTSDRLTSTTTLMARNVDREGSRGGGSDERIASGPGVSGFDWGGVAEMVSTFSASSSADHSELRDRGGASSKQDAEEELVDERVFNEEVDDEVEGEHDLPGGLGNGHEQAADGRDTDVYWSALAAELRSLAGSARKERLASLSVDDEVGLREWLLLQRGDLL
eukprot:TRINITY_DN67021_c0_g1_i1.p1 TRINITY_DN67021_c0_g1~~TRINITY_DN67021_c0_g1_i1.p1  ORF type:complete len:359 (+),score=80.42 TRINITY_DN67021_c0_g1_i1:98-1174(+)